MEFKRLPVLPGSVSRRPKLEVSRPEIAMGEEFLRQLLSFGRGIVHPGNLLYRNRLMAWLRQGITATTSRRVAATVVGRRLAGPVLLASGAVLALVVYKKAKSLQPVLVSDGDRTVFYPGPFVTPVTIVASEVAAIRYEHGPQRLRLSFEHHDGRKIQVFLREVAESNAEVLRICRERICAHIRSD